MEGVARISGLRGSTYTRLRVFPLGEGVGLVTIYVDNNRLAISSNRSVFERLAPGSIERVEALVAPIKLGQGNSIRPVTPELYDALSDAYREASRPVSSLE